jgi:hypothetical protein
LLSELGEAGKGHQIKVKEGTFDVNASFDRSRSADMQLDIDDIVQTEGHSPREKPSKSDTPRGEPETPATEAVGNGDIDDVVDAFVAQPEAEPSDSAPVSNDNVDDIINAVADNAPAEPEISKTVSNDDIDDIINAAADNTPAEPENPKTVSNDDIDDIFNTVTDDTKVEPEKSDNSEPVNNDTVNDIINATNPAGPNGKVTTAAKTNGQKKDANAEPKEGIAQDDIDALISSVDKDSPA